jgi:pimeloyl-ACP methyl ester carboxylesterase
MATQFATSADGTRIAYDATGKGRALILLHGGGQTRQEWHRLGYVERLAPFFKVITIDIRRYGESDKPADRDAYTTEKLGQDILAVADACDIDRFILCGFSYGANIGRYLAIQSDRVSRLIMIGIPFGLGASGGFRQFIEGFQAQWQPRIDSERAGTLDKTTLTVEERAFLEQGEAALTVASLGAMLDWGTVEPADLPCPTLWLIGSANQEAMASRQEYEDQLALSQVQMHIFDGFSHDQELTEINQTFPRILAFCQW